MEKQPKGKSRMVVYLVVVASLAVACWILWSYTRVHEDKKLVLVTGGLGFIGSHTVELLLKRGYQVEVLDDVSNGHNFAQIAASHDSKWTRGDITVSQDYNSIQGKVSNDPSGRGKVSNSPAVATLICIFN